MRERQILAAIAAVIIMVAWGARASAEEAASLRTKAELQAERVLENPGAYTKGEMEQFRDTACNAIVAAASAAAQFVQALADLRRARTARGK